MELSAALESVLAAPEDDAPRLVYADALLEAGDPMGEFLRLEFDRAHKRSSLIDDQRAQDLLIVHWKRWLGPLARIVHRRRSTFDRGFVTGAVISLPQGKSALSPDRLAEIAACPLWRLMRTIEVESGLPEAVLAVLQSPHLTRLAELDAASGLLAALGPKPLAFSLARLTVQPNGGQVGASPGWSRLALLTLMLQGPHVDEHGGLRGEMLAAVRSLVSPALVATVEKVELGVHGYAGWKGAGAELSALLQLGG